MVMMMVFYGENVWTMWKFMRTRTKRTLNRKRFTDVSPCWLFSWTPFVYLYFLSDWEEEQVSSPNILRLIYQGRFLHGNVTLGGEKTQKVHLSTQRKEKKHLCAHRRTHKLTAVCRWKVLCCSHPFPEPQNRGTSVLRTSQLWLREGGERK